MSPAREKDLMRGAEETRIKSKTETKVGEAMSPVSSGHHPPHFSKGDTTNDTRVVQQFVTEYIRWEVSPSPLLGRCRIF